MGIACDISIIARAVPRAWDILRKGIVDGLRKVGGAITYATQRIVTVLHRLNTVFISFLQEVQLRDLGHGLLVVLEVLLVKLPRVV